MKISIITAAYNSAGTIAETMDTVAKQIYTDLEHLVIDGRSTDDTLRVVEAHRHPNLVLILIRLQNETNTKLNL